VTVASINWYETEDDLTAAEVQDGLALQTSVDDLETRLTAARAGYLDELRKIDGLAISGDNTYGGDANDEALVLGTANITASWRAVRRPAPSPSAGRRAGGGLRVRAHVRRTAGRRPAGWPGLSRRRLVAGDAGAGAGQLPRRGVHCAGHPGPGAGQRRQRAVFPGLAAPCRLAAGAGAIGRRGAARRMLYVATWFGNGDQYLDRETGIWQCWLDYGEFLSACQEYGEALGRPGVFGQTGSVVIRK